MQQAFRQLWRSNALIGVDVELEGFQSLSANVFDTFRYMLGVAALMNQEHNKALRIHQSLFDDLTSDKRIIKSPISGDLKRFLSYEKFKSAHEMYLRSREAPKALALLKECLLLYPGNLDVYSLRAIIEFEFEKNPNKALKTCNALAALSGKNAAWKYSAAFLLLFLDREDKALNLYRELEKGSFEGEDTIVDQVIRFNEARLDLEPKRSFPLFILGFVFQTKKNDLKAAKKHYDEFLRRASSSRHPKLLIETRTRRSQVAKQLKTIV